MKKTLITIGIVIILIGGYFIWHNGRTGQLPPSGQATTTETARFTSADQKVSFVYPVILSVSQKNNIITLHHQINYLNADFCDMKGDAPQSPTLTDFHTTMQIYNLTVASTSQLISPYIPPENIIGTTLKINPGFIDAYNNGPWNGYMIYEGAEGCGQVTYYIPLSSLRTLVIQKQLIGALSDISGNKQAILAVPGVISPEQSDQIFNSIIQSLQAH